MGRNDLICMLDHEKTQIFLGGMLLLCACIIYLLFRSKSIYLYQWCMAVGLTDIIDQLRKGLQSWILPDFFRYSLPDGLYCASYILLMDVLWKRSRLSIRLLVVSAIPLIAVVHESLQAAGVVRGTFDWWDLLCYTLPLIIYLFIIGKSF